jgi:hypothetical protein
VLKFYVILALPSNLFSCMNKKITIKCIVREKVNKLFLKKNQD